jgi:hypothetical protein
MTLEQEGLRRALAKKFAEHTAKSGMTPHAVAQAVAAAYADFLTTLIVSGYASEVTPAMHDAVYLPAQRTMYLLDRMLREDIETTLVEHLRAKGANHGGR